MTAAILTLEQARRTQHALDTSLAHKVPAPDVHELAIDELTGAERTDFGLLDDVAGTSQAWRDTQPSDYIPLLEEPIAYTGPRMAALRREGGLADDAIIILAVVTLAGAWLLRIAGAWGAA